LVFITQIYRDVLSTKRKILSVVIAIQEEYVFKSLAFGSELAGLSSLEDRKLCFYLIA